MDFKMKNEMGSGIITGKILFHMIEGAFTSKIL